MNKYIPAEKLIAEIKRRKDEWQALINKNNAVNPTAVKEVICEDLNILDIIASLQQEQPESGSSEKPNNLLSEKQEQPEVDLEKEVDEAAEEYAKSKHSDALLRDIVADDFKAGAEWMSKQGFLFEDEVFFLGSMPFLKDADFDILDAPESFKSGDKVIVQIRKKQ